MSARPRSSAGRYLRVLLSVGAICTAVASAGVPSADAAVTQAGGSSGLHDGMMPAGSLDGQATAGAAVGAKGTAGAAVGPSVTAVQSVGSDVSSHQHVSGASIDWAQVAASGQAFAIVKATELYTDSTTGQPVLYTNPYLNSDLSGAHAAGLVVGSYAFAHPENSATTQADDFASALGVLPAGSLPPVLDLEMNGGLTVDQLVSWTQTFLNRLADDTGIVPMIYTGPNFWATSMGNSAAFASYPLWEAHYTTAAAPAPIGGWSTYDLWQFTNAATIPGIAGSVDQDRFNGPALTALAQSTGPRAISAKASDPATASLIGSPTTGVFCGLANGGCGQQFSNDASIYWSPATGAHELNGAIRTRWIALGWEHNLGYPTTDLLCGLADGGCGQQFSNNASIYWSPGTGAHEVSGAIRSEWAAWGWEQKLGYPTTDQFCGLTNGGCGQQFSNNASIYWSPATGAHEVSGAIRSKWAALGWEHNLGYPTTDQFCGLANGGCGQQFSNNASIYWTARTGAREVRGGIRGRWAALGWEHNLGYPTTDQFCGLAKGGCGQQFSNNASIYWTARTGAHEVTGAIRRQWAATGWEHGRYGYPIGSAYLSGSHRLQRFQRGTIAVPA